MLSLRKEKKTTLSRQSVSLNEMVGGGGGKKKKKKEGCQGFTVLHLCRRANVSLCVATDSWLHLLMQPQLKSLQELSVQGEAHKDNIAGCHEGNNGDVRGGRDKQTETKREAGGGTC